MKPQRSLLLLCIALVVGLLCVTFASGQSIQQREDDGYFNVYMYMSASGNYISASASNPEPDSYEDFYNYLVIGQPVWELSGGNYHNSGQGSSFSSGPVPLGNSYDASFQFFIEYYYQNPYAGGEFDGGCQQDIGGGECRGTDNLVADLSLYLAPAQPIPPDPCSVGSNQAAGFTSIVPSGINLGISGNFSVSFGGSDFAGINPTVAYGPYSTPESIAANMAALITRNYARYGLTAKAFGRNVIYSGTATTSSGSGTLGLVTNVFSGNGGVSSSFLENPSPTAANEAGLACESAPPPPPTPVCGVDSGTPRKPINVPARITLARSLLSPQCQTKLAVLPGYTTTKLFSTLSKALFCQYPNTPPYASNGALANTHVYTNTIDLLPDFYPPSLDNKGQAFTLIHEGIHLVGRGTLDDQTVINDLNLIPLNLYDTDVITRYIAGGCYP